MKYILLAQLEIEIPDDACIGCALKSLEDKINSQITDGLMNVVQTDNCQKPEQDVMTNTLSFQPNLVAEYVDESPDASFENMDAGGLKH